MAKNSPRIAFFFGWLGVGGIARTYSAVIPELFRDYSIDVIVFDGSRKEFGSIAEFADNVHEIFPRGGFRWYKPLCWVVAVWKTAMILRYESYSLLIVCGHMETLLAALCRGRRTRRLVIQQHADWEPEVTATRNRATMVLRRWIASRVMRSADRIMAVSKGVADGLIETIGVKPELVDIVPNPVAVSESASRGDVLLEQGDLAWYDDNFFHFISVGRLTDAKNYEFLISVFGELVSASAKARLAIVGGGELQESLARQIDTMGLSGHVRLFGYREDVESHLLMADSFVSTSKWEGFGNAIMEAMACGLPVIATDCSGPRDIIGDDQRYGLLVRSGDSDGFKAAMRKILDDSELRLRYASASQERSRDFRPAKVARIYKAIIDEEILAESAS